MHLATSPNRRQMIAQLSMMGLLTAASSSSGLAMGSSSRLRLGLLMGLAEDTERDSGLEKLMWEASKRTSMLTDETPKRMGIDGTALYECPLLVLSGRGKMMPLDDKQMGRLRHFLKLGGTLFVDDASSMGDDRFDRSFRETLTRLWTDGELAPFQRDHTFYRTFYLLGGSRGRIDRDSRLYGVTFEDRSPIIYSRNDLFGALCRDQTGEWALPVRPGGARQRELALRFGLNLLMYATCLNYKRDQVHVPAILKRRKWRVGDQ